MPIKGQGPAGREAKGPGSYLHRGKFSSRPKCRVIVKSPEIAMANAAPPTAGHQHLTFPPARLLTLL